MVREESTGLLVLEMDVGPEDASCEEYSVPVAQEFQGPCRLPAHDFRQWPTSGSDIVASFGVSELPSVIPDDEILAPEDSRSVEFESLASVD